MKLERHTYCGTAHKCKPGDKNETCHITTAHAFLYYYLHAYIRALSGQMGYLILRDQSACIHTNIVECLDCNLMEG